MAELTSTGYVLKPQNEWFAEETQLYLYIDPNWNLDPSTPDGLKIAADAETFANLDELGQRAYNSKDPNKAKNIDLNIICSLTGTVRSEGTPSIVPVRLGGVPGTVVAAGQLIRSTVDESTWSTDNTVTIGVGGTVDTTATCTVNGATQASIGTITRLVTTVGGWQTVTNYAVATSGTNRQSDSSLRSERAKSVGRPGSNQVDNMLGEIFAVSGVRRAVVLENDTGATNVDGLPPHSIAPIVDGGTDQDVALAIFRKKNPGCRMYAAGTSVVVPDVFDRYPSNKKTITFSRPIYVPMIIVVVIENDGSLPGDAEDLVTQAILRYSSGDLVGAECGFNALGFDIGEEVPISRIFTPINQVIGQYGNSYVSTLTVNGSSSGQVTIDFNELSQWTEANISVTVNG
jgi:hypothetical protein